MKQQQSSQCHLAGDKDKGKQADKQNLDRITVVYNELFKHPLTRKQVSVITAIDRANICWYIRDFRKVNQVAVIKKGKCPITRHTAEFISTNPKFFPKKRQLKMF